jgi:hypothetical protein
MQHPDPNSFSNALYEAFAGQIVTTELTTGSKVQGKYSANSGDADYVRLTPLDENPQVIYIAIAHIVRVQKLGVG